MERAQFTFYRSYYEAIRELPKKDQTDVLLAVCAYALDSEEPKLSGTASAIFTLIRPTLDTGRRKAMGGKNGRPTKDKEKIEERCVKDSAKEKEGEKEREKENECLKENKKENADKPSKKTGYDIILAQIKDNSLRDLYYEYIKMRKMIKSPMTDRALTMLINKVNELEPNNVERQKQVLNNAILNNWKSVYPLRENTGTEVKKSRYADVYKKLEEAYMK